MLDDIAFLLSRLHAREAEIATLRAELEIETATKNCYADQNIRAEDLSGIHGNADEIAACLLARAEAAETRLARVRALSATWLAESERHEKHGDCYRKGQGWGMKDCAEALDAALADPPHDTKE
jgi:hypothetical protein